jgi:hypothetical protein
MPADALRRFTPTLIESSFALHRATVSVATNCQFLADRLLDAFASPDREPMAAPVFVWRVVVESDDDLELGTDPVGSRRLSLDGLAFVSIGQRSFLACDLQVRQGVSFMSKRFVYDETLFRQYFLPALTSLVIESTEALREPRPVVAPLVTLRKGPTFRSIPSRFKKLTEI